MESYIRIKRYPYEEPHHLNLVIEASSGNIKGKLEFYANTNSLLNISKALNEFPRHKHDKFLWELGSERPEDNFGFYFRFRVFTINSTGKCAIHLKFNNNQQFPNLEVTEFCIKAEPAGLNRLGKLFSEFSKLEHLNLEWDSKEGRIY